LAHIYLRLAIAHVTCYQLLLFLFLTLPCWRRFSLLRRICKVSLDDWGSLFLRLHQLTGWFIYRKDFKPLLLCRRHRLLWSGFITFKFHEFEVFFVGYPGLVGGTEEVAQDLREHRRRIVFLIVHFFNQIVEPLFLALLHEIVSLICHEVGHFYRHIFAVDTNNFCFDSCSLKCAEAVTRSKSCVNWTPWEYLNTWRKEFLDVPLFDIRAHVKEDVGMLLGQLTLLHFYSRLIVVFEPLLAEWVLDYTCVMSESQRALMVYYAEKIVCRWHQRVNQKALVLNVRHHVKVVKRKLNLGLLLAPLVVYLLESLELDRHYWWESAYLQCLYVLCWFHALFAVDRVEQFLRQMKLMQTAL
jgi:hypothetical protein